MHQFTCLSVLTMLIAVFAGAADSPQMYLARSHYDVVLSPDGTAQFIPYVRNIGGGTLNWRIEASSLPPWATANFVNSALQKLTIDMRNADGNGDSNTSPGIYLAHITLRADAPALDPVQTIRVRVRVPDRAYMYLGSGSPSNTGYVYQALVGGAAPTATPVIVPLKNAGSGTLSWSAQSSASWLHLTRSSGSFNGLPSSTQQPAFTVNPAGLSAGTYNATLTLNATEALNGPLLVPVTLLLRTSVPSAPTLFAQKTDFTYDFPSFSHAGGLGSSLASGPAAYDHIPLRNIGGVPLQLKPMAATSAGWLELTHAAPTLAAGASTTLTLRLRPEGLPPGTHRALAVIDSNSVTGPLVLHFTLNIRPDSPNRAPELEALTASPTPGVPGRPVTFEATLRDQENDPLTYTWRFYDGTVRTGNPITRSFSSGANNVVLLASDGINIVCRRLQFSVLSTATSAPPTFTQQLSITPATAVVGEPVLFNAAATDPDGLLSWRITFGDGTSATNTGKSASVVHAYSTPGTYTATVTFSDGASTLASTGQVTIMADPDPLNQRPFVDAAASHTSGSSIRVYSGSLLNLNGTVSDDGRPLIPGTLTRQWSKLSGPGTALFANPAADDTTVVFSAAGEYVLMLSADDGLALAADLLNVTVLAPVAGANLAPSVSAGADRVTAANSSITLLGAASDDGLPAPARLSVNWSVLSAPGQASFSSPGSLASPLNVSTPGLYLLRLSASDGALSSYDEVSVIVNGGANTPPVAANQSVSTPEDSAKAISLTGSDAEGDPLTYAIASLPRFGTLSGSGALRTYMPRPEFNGSDSFTFTVSDGQAVSLSATVSITVLPVNDAPVAQSQSVTVVQNVAKSILLSGSDVEGAQLSYSLVGLPAKGTLSGSGAMRTYTPYGGALGSDSFTFRVNDASLSSNTATVSLTIVPSTLNEANPAPTLVSTASATPNPGMVGGTIVFSVAASDSDSLSYTWDFGDGSNAPGATASHVYTAAGVYHATVSISDGASSIQDRVTVTIGTAVVYAGATPSGGDLDDDGVSDANEAADGTDPNDPNSVRKSVLKVTRLSCNTRFSPRTDSCMLTGSLELGAAEFTPLAQTVSIDIGGAREIFTLDRKAKGATGASSILLKRKPGRKSSAKSAPAAPAATGTLQFNTRLKAGTWYENWRDEGLSAELELKKVPLTIVVELRVSGRVYTGSVPCEASSKPGQRGKLSGKPAK